MKMCIAYEPTVGELIDALRKFNRNNKIWFSCRSNNEAQEFPPVGQSGNYGSKYCVTIDEASYQDTVYVEIRK